MLTMSHAQIKVFQDQAAHGFAAEIAARCRDFAPERHALLEPACWRKAADESVSTARRIGFDRRGPARSFAEWQILLGAGFLSDPLMPWAAAAIEPDSDPAMERAARLHEEAVHYLTGVDGAGGEHREAACAALAALCRQGLPWPQVPSVNDLVKLMHHLHPRKAEHLGQADLHEATRHALDEVLMSPPGGPVRDAGLVLLLQFLFGHRVMDDPWWPWRHEAGGTAGQADASARPAPMGFQLGVAVLMDRLLARSAGTA